MDEELQNRIRRIYAAIGDTVEVDISKFRPHVMTCKKYLFVCQEFRMGLNDQQISNIAHSAIHNVANLWDHLRKWAIRAGRNPERVNQAVKQSFELQVIVDLSNVDKHGYPPRDGGYSGRAPKLSEVNRVMWLSTGTQPNSSASLMFTPKPVARFTGSGSARVVVTGTIVDKDGVILGDLAGFVAKGTAAWENLFDELGIKTDDSA